MPYTTVDSQTFFPWKKSLRQKLQLNYLATALVLKICTYKKVNG